MEINSLFFISVVPAIVLYGIAKSGLGGSISLISVPLMTVVMPLQQALAIILPILIFSDMIAIMSEKINIGKIIASACCNGITTVIKGTDINDIEPPKPDFAIPYKTIAGTTLIKKSEFISINLKIVKNIQKLFLVKVY